MVKITLNNGKIVGEGFKPYFIAEVNTSHFGDVSKAKALIDMVKNSGADCVKFQSWSEHTLYSNEYYKENPIAKRFVKKFSMSEDQLIDLSEYAKSIGIDFASTPYSIDEANFLIDKCKVPFIKVASMDINNYPYLKYLAKTKSAIVLSTGMADLEEIVSAIEVLESNGARNVCILHCVSIYPVDPGNVNLNNILLLKNTFEGYPVGYSDHTLGIDIGISSIALGATMIEKHVTLNNSIIGMDNQMAIEPDELNQMVLGVNNVFRSLGSFERIVSEEEQLQRIKMRRSLVAATELNPGDILTESNLGAKRPGSGISVSKLNSCIGKIINRRIEKDSIITPEDLN